MEDKEPIRERKEGKVKCKGTYKEFIAMMEARGSFFSLAKQKEVLNNKTLARFEYYKGYIGKDVDSMMAISDTEIDDLPDKTKITIESSGFTNEEINEAIYKAYNYLKKLERKNSKKSFFVYKTE